MVLPIYDIEGKQVDNFSLDKEIFDGSVNEPLLHQAIINILANKRQGTASTKTRGEVSGGGKKPWKQKGTGRARAGSIRSPLWRHGGVVFGPHPRDFSYDLPKRIKRNALASSLNAKLKDNEVKIVDKIALSAPKTKDLCALMEKLKVSGSTLLILENIDNFLSLASRNVEGLTLARSRDLNAYEVLRHKNVLITKEALEGLTKALKEA